MQRFFSVAWLFTSDNGKNPKLWKTSLNQALTHLSEENNTSCGPLSSDAMNASLLFNISKVIKLIIFNSQVISTCELVNRDIKNIIFSSETNYVNQNVLQMCLKIAKANFFFDTAFLSFFDIV